MPSSTCRSSREILERDIWSHEWCAERLRLLIHRLFQRESISLYGFFRVQACPSHPFEQQTRLTGFQLEAHRRTECAYILIVSYTRDTVNVITRQCDALCTAILSRGDTFASPRSRWKAEPEARAFIERILLDHNRGMAGRRGARLLL